jgi:hypothetical protein
LAGLQFFFSWNSFLKERYYLGGHGAAAGAGAGAQSFI